MEPQELIAYVESIIKGITEYPKEVKVERKDDERGVLFTLFVAPEDMGRVIGKGGETADAIRKILRALGFRTQQIIHLKIHDERREKKPQVV